MWAKSIKISGILDAISPARHPQKSSQYVRACVEGDGAICSKNRKIVPYPGASPNTRNDARLRSPFPIMAPAKRYNREFKQIAGATTAAVTEKAWGEYVSVVCQILTKRNTKMSET